MKTALLFITAGGFFVNGAYSGSAELEGQLYEDLLYDYNKIPRPVKNSTDILTVDVGASLIRIIDVVSTNESINFIFVDIAKVVKSIVWVITMEISWIATYMIEL